MRTLTLEQIARGRAKAWQNAADLIHDADVLVRHQRWARAVFLAQIAIEELGQYLLLVEAMEQVSTQRMDWPAFWKQFRTPWATQSHRRAWPAELSPCHVADTTREPGSSRQRDQAELAQQKRAALYVEYQAHQFVLPMDRMDERLAQHTLALAKAALAIFAYGEEVFGTETVTHATPETWADAQ